MDNSQIKQKAAKGFWWVSFYSVIARLIQLAANLILAGILNPQDWGAFAIGMVLVNGLMMFREMGFSPALVQIQEDVERAFRAAMVAIPLFGLAVFLVIYAAAPIFAGLVGDYSVLPIIRALGVIAIISALGAVPMVYLQRHFRFRQKILPESLSFLVSGGVAIILAKLDYGVWSLVYSVIAYEAVRCIMYWSIVGFIFKPSVDFPMWKRLFKYGINVSFGSTFGFLFTLIDRFIVGRYYGTEKAGHYTFANQLTNFTANILIVVSNQVVLSTLSSLQNDREQYNRTYLLTQSIFALISFPIAAGIFIFGGDLLHLLYGTKWEGAIAVLKIFAVYGLFRSITTINTEVFLSKGKPRYFTLKTGLKILLCLAFLPLALQFKSIEAIAILFTGALGITSLLTYYLASRVMNLAGMSILKIYLPHFIAIIWSYGAIYFIPNSHFFLRAAIFGLMYLISLYIFNKSLIIRCKDFINLMLTRVKVNEG